ncbi:hypothetical protein NDA03_26430 [Trichocoleus sp. Lan]|uniref:hypothetical protein n=1 Tax=Trichocoleus sp. Lan TaxID=2933927 RepID=UPI003299C688
MTNSVWEDLGEIADSKEITKANLIEDVVKSEKLKKTCHQKAKYIASELKKHEEGSQRSRCNAPGKDVGAIKHAFDAF